MPCLDVERMSGRGPTRLRVEDMLPGWEGGAHTPRGKNCATPPRTMRTPAARLTIRLSTGQSGVPVLLGLGMLLAAGARLSLVDAAWTTHKMSEKSMATGGRVIWRRLLWTVTRRARVIVWGLWQWRSCRGCLCLCARASWSSVRLCTYLQTKKGQAMKAPSRPLNAPFPRKRWAGRGGPSCRACRYRRWNSRRLML